MRLRNNEYGTQYFAGQNLLNPGIYRFFKKKIGERAFFFFDDENN